LINLIDIPKLVDEAASLRPGHQATAPSTLIPGQTLFGQGSNFHFVLTFDDGIKWVVRIRKRTWEGPSLEALKLNTESEVVTLQTMAKAGIAVPNAWARPDHSRGESAVRV